MKSNFLAIAFLVLTTSCSSQPRTIIGKFYDPTHRVEILTEIDPGPALSSAKHRVYVVNGNKRDLIFEGYGGKTVAIKPLREGIILIEYCGGSIRKTASFLANRANSDNAVAVMIQPIIIANVEIGGNRLCAE